MTRCSLWRLRGCGKPKRRGSREARRLGEGQLEVRLQSRAISMPAKCQCGRTSNRGECVMRTGGVFLEGLTRHQNGK